MDIFDLIRNYISQIQVHLHLENSITILIT